MRGRSGNDRLAGGAGDDDLDGGMHVDTVAGGLGHDTARGGENVDPMGELRTAHTAFGTIDGAAGDDVVAGGDREKTLYGRDGDDELLGSMFGDVADGGAGAGADVLRLDNDGDFDADFTRLLNPDRVRCGTGLDAAWITDFGAGMRDHVEADCEQVNGA